MIKTIGDMIWIHKRNVYVSTDERFVIQRRDREYFKIYEKLEDNKYYDETNPTHLDIGNSRRYKYTCICFSSFANAAEFVDSVLSEQVSLF